MLNNTLPTKKQLNFIQTICNALYDGENMPNIKTKEEAQKWISEHISEYNAEASIYFTNWYVVSRFD